MGAIILIDERDSLIREAILRGRVAEIVGESASEPHAHLRTRARVESGERSVERFTCGEYFICGWRIHFHCPDWTSLPNRSKEKRSETTVRPYLNQWS